jgi:hypothetical protein
VLDVAGSAARRCDQRADREQENEPSRNEGNPPHGGVIGVARLPVLTRSRCLFPPSEG